MIGSNFIKGFLTATASISLSVFGFLGTESILLRANAQLVITDPVGVEIWSGLRFGMTKAQVTSELTRQGKRVEVVNDRDNRYVGLSTTTEMDSDTYEVRMVFKEDYPLADPTIPTGLHLVGFERNGTRFDYQTLVGNLTLKYGKPSLSGDYHFTEKTTWQTPTKEIEASITKTLRSIGEPSEVVSVYYSSPIPVSDF